MKVVGMNLLNYFNTFDGLPDNVDNCSLGVGGGPTDCRGADTQAEFDRQWPKTVAAIAALNADVVGVNEIENDGYGPDSAIQHLVTKLNEAMGANTYAFIDVDARTGQVNAMGTDAIKVAMIYKPAKVTPVGTTAALNSVAFVNGGDSTARNRPSLAQAFEEISTGSRFIVDINHLKSKGSACDAPDAGDGQGNCNIVRTNAANTLTAWLASDPTGTGSQNILIMGDLNSYAMEDPVTAIKNAGFTNLISSRIGADAYSYVFDGQWGYLDHALGSAAIVPQVSGVGEYHINADEPSVLDYNTDFKTANLQTILYAPDQFRISDHDPVIVGLNLGTSDPEILSLSLKQSADKLTWSPVSGTLTGGYAMALNPGLEYQYLDVASLVPNKSLKEDYHPFYLDQASLPAGFMTYWEAKGVISGASGWQGVMYQTITGAQPMFYLKVGPGPSYMLVDGLQKLAGAGDQLLRISGDYPLGAYTFNGVLTDNVGGSKPLSVNMTFEALPEITALALKQSKDTTSWSPVSGSLAGGYTMPLDEAVLFYYLNVESLTANKSLKEDYHPFYLDQASLPAGYMAYWAGKGVVSGVSGWQGVMYQIISGAQPMFYLKVGAGPSYMLVDGLQKLAGAGDNPLRISGDYPLGAYTFNGVLTDTIGGSKPLSVKMTFTRQQYTLTTSVIGSGSVTREPDKTTYDAGEPVKLTAKAPAGWKFDGWSGDSTSTSTEITIIMTGDKSYTATFSQIEYTLTVIIQGGGVVIKSPEKTTYHLNDVVTLTADYTWGWSFGGWSGDVTSTANPVSVTITGNMTVTATFNPLSPGLEPRIILPLIYNYSTGN
ncbi:MAG TPA: ExeM/NucH family extracellular endonuclease [Anaerolineaceae bacterium]